VLWLQIFHTRKVIASSLRNCYSKEGLSTALWSFFLSVAPFLSLLLPYKKVRNSQKRCRSSAMASYCVIQKQLLTHVNIIMKHTPIYNRHNVFARVLLSLINQTLISVQGVIACSISACTEKSLVNCLYHFCSENIQILYIVDWR